MTEEVSIDVIKKTQETLGKFIKKPQLKEKLLKKPPFRFLHDIITNVINDTGFLKGLYNDTEMTSENIKDRDSKIAFLDKLINVLKIVTETKISARPSKIIAGLEPTKTNQLLQVIGAALEKKLDSTEAVARVTGNKLPADKPKKTKQEDNLVRGKTQDRIQLKKKPSPKTEKENRKNSEVSNEPTKKTSKTKQDSKEVESPKEAKEKNRGGNPIEAEKERNKEEVEEAEVDDNKKAIDKADVKIHNDRKERKSARRNKHDDQDVKQVEINITPHYPDNNQSESIEILNTDSNNKQIDEQTVNSTDTTTKPTDIPTEQTPTETSTKPTKTSAKPTETSKSKTLSKPPEPKPTELVSKPIELVSKSTEKPSEMSTKPIELSTKSQEDSRKDVKRPASTLRPPSVRPSSARPGAPRLKDRNETILPPDQVVPLGRVNVIVESSKNEQDEEETVVVETPMENNTLWPAVEIVPDNLLEQKGHLVSQILEQIGETPITTVPKPKIEWEQKFSDAGSEKLRQSIQTLTRAANPLGKLMNFLHEDVESMQNELKMWIDINDNLKTEIKIRKRKNEESMKPLQEQLARLEADIAKQNELISTTQANILRNQQKIKSLLTRD